jgi:hypothetical protein
MREARCPECRQRKGFCHCGRKTASAKEFQVIADPTTWLGKSVHVEGWKRGGWFILDAYNGGEATVRTPKTNKVYRTYNRLLKTRRNET